VWTWVTRLWRGRSTRPAVDVTIAPYERPLGRILHEAEDTPFHPIESLDSARTEPNAYVIMEGDWGGQIYLTAPVRLLRCDVAELELILQELDAHAWSCNGGEGCGFFFEERESFEGVSGGMGGGATLRDLWIHPELVEAGFEPRVRKVLFGENRT
jgi:hypothetical protein